MVQTSGPRMQVHGFCWVERKRQRARGMSVRDLEGIILQKTMQARAGSFDPSHHVSIFLLSLSQGTSPSPDRCSMRSGLHRRSGGDQVGRPLVQF